ncbi:hypothetical protein C8Q75DRAFT_239659 [Abortiporus biennis]|nr:hypothetical protein C8Q75DRAFT_239659 [Abortiporus biennis]
MHHTLFIDEILHKVLEQYRIKDDYWDNSNLKWKVRQCRRNLSNISRVCKSFRGPALDLLWERQDSLFPLLKLLGSFYKDPSTHYYLLSPINDEEMDYFRLYSRKIKYYAHSSDKRIHPSVYSELLKNKGGSSLFPALRSIKWTRTDEPLDNILPFITPTLQNANIGFIFYDYTNSAHDDELPHSDRSQALERVLDALSDTAAHLQTLAIDGIISASTMSTIARFGQLCTLDLSAASSWTEASLLVALSLLPHLTCLHINVDESALNIPSSNTTFFPSLHTLNINGSPIAISKFAKFVTSASLQCFSIRSIYSYAGDLWLSCLEVIQSRFPSLLEFRMKLLLGPFSMTQDHENILMVVSPLLDIHGLQIVQLELEGSLRITNDNLCRMANSWPELRRLQLWCHVSGRRPTLDVLETCARKCLSLHHLELPMDVRWETRPDQIEDLPTSFALKKINLLGDVKMDDVDNAMVASVFKKLFPRLYHFEAYSWDRTVTQRLRVLKNLILGISEACATGTEGRGNSRQRKNGNRSNNKRYEKQINDYYPQ